MRWRGSCQTRKSAPTSCSTFIFLLILLVKANEFKFNFQSNSNERESTNPIRIQSQFVFFLCVYRAADELDCSLSGALLLHSLYRIFTHLYISDHSQRFCCGWWLYFWLHPEYSEWQYDSPEGLAWLWQSQQVKQDSCSTRHFFARKLKMSIKRGFFCANLGSSPNFAYHSQPSIRQPVLAFLSDPFCFLK